MLKKKFASSINLSFNLINIKLKINKTFKFIFK